MSILRIRDSNGNIQEILVLKGDSVTVSSVVESTEDGGENVVTFSDGNTLTVKNGSSGKDGQNYTLTSDDIERIANQVSAQAQVLPTVTETDNGKFIKVINGEWAAVRISNAEEMMF